MVSVRLGDLVGEVEASGRPGPAGARGRFAPEPRRTPRHEATPARPRHPRQPPSSSQVSATCPAPGAAQRRNVYAPVCTPVLNRSRACSPVVNRRGNSADSSLVRGGAYFDGRQREAAGPGGGRQPTGESGGTAHPDGPRGSRATGDSTSSSRRRVAHAGVHRGRELRQLVPYLLSRGMPPVEGPGGQARAGEDVKVLAGVPRAGSRALRSSSLYPPLAVGHRAVGLAPARAGRQTTLARPAVRVITISCTTRYRARPEFNPAMLVGLRIGRVLSNHIQRLELAVLHGLEHAAQVQALFRRIFIPTLARTCRAIRHSRLLKAGQAVWDGPHVPAALHIVLPAQRIQPRAIFPHMPGQGARLISPRTLSTALWCSVMPSVQQMTARSDSP